MLGRGHVVVGIFKPIGCPQLKFALGSFLENVGLAAEHCPKTLCGSMPLRHRISSVATLAAFVATGQSLIGDRAEMQWRVFGFSKNRDRTFDGRFPGERTSF